MYINVIRKKVSFFLGFLSVLILFSCVPASDVPLPTEEEIKNNILNEFNKLAEDQKFILPKIEFKEYLYTGNKKLKRVERLK